MRRNGIEVALAATVGAVLALVVWSLMQRTDATNESAQQDQSSTDGSQTANVPNSPTTQPLREQAELDAFIDTFTASRTGTYKVTGHLQIAQAGTEDTSQIDVATVRRGSDLIDDVGTTLLIVLDGQEQSCERVSDEQLVCGQTLEPTPVEAEAAGLAELFAGPDPDYLLYDDQPGCWQLVATSNPAPAQWGQSTTICFDPDTGAIARQTTSSVQGIRTFVAETISGVVTDEDLIPPSS